MICHGDERRAARKRIQVLAIVLAVAVGSGVQRAEFRDERFPLLARRRSERLPEFVVLRRRVRERSENSLMLGQGSLLAEFADFIEKPLEGPGFPVELRRGVVGTPRHEFRRREMGGA